MIIATISMKKMKENCEQPFMKPRNRTLELYKFFARKRKEKETLRQFWLALTGMAAKCDFGDQTESLNGRVHTKYEQQISTRKTLYGTKGRSARSLQIRSSVRGRNSTTQDL